MDINLKIRLTQACENYLAERIARIEVAIKDLEEALKLETKCSMGDKYETGRAMLHLEFEKLSTQHEEYRKLRKTLHMVNTGKSSGVVSFGSIVCTGKVNYFIAIPAGELVVDEQKYYAVGAGAPIAKVLSGKSTGDLINFNGKELVIKEVL